MSVSDNQFYFLVAKFFHYTLSSWGTSILGTLVSKTLKQENYISWHMRPKAEYVNTEAGKWEREWWEEIISVI